jgi:hypothetical protein
MKSKSQKAKLPAKKPAMRFYKGNKYSCEKMSFKTRKEAFEGIWVGGDDTNLRPYKCDRCECWHLTHKKERSLWEDKFANMALKPNEIRYWVKLDSQRKDSLRIKTNLMIPYNTLGNTQMGLY